MLGTDIKCLGSVLNLIDKCCRGRKESADKKSFEILLGEIDDSATSHRAKALEHLKNEGVVESYTLETILEEDDFYQNTYAKGVISASNFYNFTCEYLKKKRAELTKVVNNLQKLFDILDTYNNKVPNIDKHLNQSYLRAIESLRQIARTSPLKNTILQVLPKYKNLFLLAQQSSLIQGQDLPAVVKKLEVTIGLIRNKIDRINAYLNGEEYTKSGKETRHHKGVGSVFPFDGYYKALDDFTWGDVTIQFITKSEVLVYVRNEQRLANPLLLGCASESGKLHKKWDFLYLLSQNEGCLKSEHVNDLNKKNFVQRKKELQQTFQERFGYYEDLFSKKPSKGCMYEILINFKKQPPQEAEYYETSPFAEVQEDLTPSTTDYEHESEW